VVNLFAEGNNFCVLRFSGFPAKLAESAENEIILSPLSSGEGLGVRLFCVVCGICGKQNLCKSVQFFGQPPFLCGKIFCTFKKQNTLPK